jgi:hypothetical protein
MYGSAWIQYVEEQEEAERKAREEAARFKPGFDYAPHLKAVSLTHALDLSV